MLPPLRFGLRFRRLDYATLIFSIFSYFIDIYAGHFIIFVFSPAISSIMADYH